MDSDIVQSIAAKRYEQAFETMLDRYENKVFRLVFSYVRNEGRAQEVTQEVFMKLWQALPGYDSRASLSTWIYTIARNTSFTHLRSEAYRKTEPLESGPEPASFESTAEHLEVERLLSRLPEDQREVITLFYLQERSIADVALMLDLPEGTVKSQLFRARKALGAMMEVRS